MTREEKERYIRNVLDGTQFVITTDDAMAILAEDDPSETVVPDEDVGQVVATTFEGKSFSITPAPGDYEVMR